MPALEDEPLAALIMNGECRPPAPPGEAGEGRSDWAVRYRGAANLRTIKEVAFLGGDQNLVAAGSDGGRLLLWERRTGRLLTVARGDYYAVNCIRGHPRLPLLATSGIDSSVKLWAPAAGAPRSRRDVATVALVGELTRRSDGLFPSNF